VHSLLSGLHSVLVPVTKTRTKDLFYFYWCGCVLVPTCACYLCCTCILVPTCTCCLCCTCVDVPMCICGVLVQPYEQVVREEKWMRDHISRAKTVYQLLQHSERWTFHQDTTTCYPVEHGCKFYFPGLKLVFCQRIYMPYFCNSTVINPFSYLILKIGILTSKFVWKLDKSDFDCHTPVLYWYHD